jgi:hypothetical protein
MHSAEVSRSLVKVRIKKMPVQREIDGVSLKGMVPGAVRDVSPVLGSWLIAEEYADVEMRARTSIEEELDDSFSPGEFPSVANDRRRRKR